jgi:hypothetical protein
VTPSRARAVVLVASVVALGCGAGQTGAAVSHASTSAGARSTGDGRPSLDVVLREGDGLGALSIAVTTAGLAADRGALVGVALAALVEARLAARGIEVTASGGWDGWRLRVLVGSVAEAARVVDGARAAMLTPVTADEPALATVARKTAALGHRLLPDRALIDAARCTGEAYGTGSDVPTTPPELESWRSAAHGLGRVAFAAAGEAWLVDATAQAMARAPAWPRASSIVQAPWPPLDTRAVVYDASGEIAPSSARVIVIARTATPERAVGAAAALGDVHGPLATRLAALEGPARVRDVVATSHVDGGCLAATIDLDARDLGADAAARIATAAALARQEITVDIAEAGAPADLGRSLATRAGDPRDAAERAAWWSLAGRCALAAEDEVRVTLTVGVASGRDTSEAQTPAVGDMIRSEIDRASLAWHAPVVETRTRVERGQGDTWVLLASTCGTLPEANGDAGVGAAVATAASLQAAAGGGDVGVEPFVASDGVGVLVHGPARAGESSEAHARRLADIAARAFAADPLTPDRMARARTTLLAHAAGIDERAMAVLAGAVSPGHPSWVDPTGTALGLATASDTTVSMKAAALREGPLRVAVLANVDAGQAAAATRAVDRWIARRPGEARVCASAPSSSPPRAGTYAVDLPAGASSQALIAVPFPPGDDEGSAAATWIAAALDGQDGLLSRVLAGSGRDAPGAPLARAWSAAVIGGPRAPTLVIRIDATDTSLDAAVAQTRVLFDRMRQGAIDETDRSRAEAALTRARSLGNLDPRARAIDLWRAKGAPLAGPSVEKMRAFAAASFRDEALVIVAARPPRVDPRARPFPGREARTKNRD